jgi:hypothetical protein
VWLPDVCVAAAGDASLWYVTQERCDTHAGCGQVSRNDKHALCSSDRGQWCESCQSRVCSTTDLCSLVCMWRCVCVLLGLSDCVSLESWPMGSWISLEWWAGGALRVLGSLYSQSHSSPLQAAHGLQHAHAAVCAALWCDHPHPVGLMSQCCCTPS